MTEQEWTKLEQRINALVESHAEQREANRALRIEREELLERNGELRCRLEAVIERIKRLELESEL
ncbi:MAG: hypothetical protein ACSHXK_09990 [Oceanococcus sp.]